MLVLEMIKAVTEFTLSFGTQHPLIDAAVRELYAPNDQTGLRHTRRVVQVAFLALWVVLFVLTRAELVSYAITAGLLRGPLTMPTGL